MGHGALAATVLHNCSTQMTSPTPVPPPGGVLKNLWIRDNICFLCLPEVNTSSHPCLGHSKFLNSPPIWSEWHHHHGKSCHRPMTAVGLRQRSDHNTSGKASQFGIQVKPDTLKVVEVSGAVLFQNTDLLVSFDSETWTAAFSVHNLLQLGSFNLCHSDITKPTLPLLSALQGPCEHPDHGKCWNGTSCTPGRFCTELIIHSGCSASLTNQPAFSTEISWGNAQRLRDSRWVCKLSTDC